MAGRHSAKSSKSSKAPLVILCIVAVIVIAAVIGAIIFMNYGGDTETPTETTLIATTAEQTSVLDTTAVATDSQTTTAVETQEQGVTQSSEQKETVNVAVPTKGGEDVSYFNATYVPYMAVDSASGEECSLKEVFGSSYTGGVITFNSDGTFTDTLTSSSVNSGAYVVEGSSIVATYTNDKNMSITVSEWENDAPSEFVINYGGYEVHFE